MSAGAAKRTTCQYGKFHGMTARTAPSGRYTTVLGAAAPVMSSSASIAGACSA